MGDVEYRIGRDPAAKGGVGVMVRLWPGGAVPYVLDTSLTQVQRDRFAAAARRWEQVAPVRFVPRSKQLDYVRVVRHETANSSCR